MKSIKSTDVKKEFALGVIKTRLSVIASNLVSNSIVFSDGDKQKAYFNLGGKVLEPSVTINNKGREKSNLPIVGGYVEVKGKDAKIDMGLVSTIYAASKVKDLKDTQGFPPVKIKNKKDDKLFGTATFATNIKNRIIQDVLDEDDKHLLTERLLNIYTATISQVEKIDDTKSKAFIPEDTTKQRVLTLTDKGAVETPLIEAKYVKGNSTTFVPFERLRDETIEHNYPTANEVGAEIGKNSVVLFEIIKNHSILNQYFNIFKVGKYWYAFALKFTKRGEQILCNFQVVPIPFVYNKRNDFDYVLSMDFYIPYVDETKNVFLAINKKGFWIRYNGKNYMMLSFDFMKKFTKNSFPYDVKNQYEDFTTWIKELYVKPVPTNEFYGSYETGDKFIKIKNNRSVTDVGTLLETMFSQGKIAYTDGNITIVNPLNKYVYTNKSIWYIDFVDFMPACGDLFFFMKDKKHALEQFYLYDFNFTKRGTMLGILAGIESYWGAVGYFSYLTNSKKHLEDVFNIKIDMNKKAIYFENTRTGELLTKEDFKEKFGDFYFEYRIDAFFKGLDAVKERYLFFLPKESIKTIKFNTQHKFDVCYYRGIPIKGINRCTRRIVK